MVDFSKNVTLSTPPGSTAERLANRLKEATSQGRGEPMNYMRKWLQAGYLLEELGHGIADSLLAFDRDGYTKDMSADHKAYVLKTLLERTLLNAELDQFMDERKASADNTTTVNKDNAKREQYAQEPVKTEPVEETVTEQIKPARRRRMQTNFS